MVKVAICQMVGGPSVEDNTAKMAEMVERAVAGRQDLDLIIFPEYCYGCPPTVAPVPKDGPHTQTIAALAKKYNVNILGGSFARKADNGKAYNTALFYNRQGEVIGEYNKTHLMVALGYDESLDVEPGNELCVFDTDFGRVGMMVCYDLRFPEVARSMVLQGAEIILCPAEFPAGKVLPPRTDHWDVLVRATALQNLTWTVACNNFGTTPAGENPFGRSMCVDPWGTVVAQCGGHEDVVYAEIDLEYQKSVRAGVASWENRRPELYTL